MNIPGLGSLFRRSPSPSPEPSDVAEPIVSSTPPVAQEEDLRRRERAAYSRWAATRVTESELQRQRQAMQLRLERAYERLDAIEQERDDLTAGLTQAREWIRRRESSYSYLLHKRLGVEKAALDESVVEVRRIMDEPAPLEPNDLDRLNPLYVGRVLRTNFAGLLVLVLATLVTWRAPKSAWLAPVASWPGFLLIGLALLVWLLIFFRVMLAYHRDWSQFQRRLDEQQTRVNYAGELLAHTRQEYVRLGDLHPQVSERLDLIAESLYRPWLIPQEVLDFEGSKPHADQMPALMRLATVPGSRGGTREEELRRRAISERIIKPGWRGEAYKLLLRCVEEVEGRPSGSLTAEQVDRSPATLAAVRSSLKTGTARELSARKMLEEVGLDLQQRILPQVHPRVASLRTDPLDGLDVTPDLLAEPDSDLEEWDVFLSGVMKRASGWSAHTFSDLGLQSASRTVNSYAFGPDRLRGKADSSVTFSPSPDAGTRPLELLVRIDVSEWCPPEWFRVFSPGSQAATNRIESQSDTSLDGVTGIDESFSGEQSSLTIIGDPPEAPVVV